MTAADYLEKARAELLIAGNAQYADTRLGFAVTAAAAALITLATQVSDLVDLFRQGLDEDPRDV